MFELSFILQVFVIFIVNGDWTDYLGVAVSTQYQINPVSNDQVADTLSNFPFTKFKFYTGFEENNTAYEIVQHIPNAQLYIEIPNYYVAALSTQIIENLMLEYESVKQNVAFIQLGNEPEYNSISYKYLPIGINLIYETLSNSGDSDWQNVQVSVPFSASLFISSYPVSSGQFQEPINGTYATFSSGVCNNCQVCDKSGTI